PASPVALAVRQRRRSVKLTVTGTRDTRIVGFDFFRHEGPGPFRLDDSDAARICQSSKGQRLERRLRPGAHRFAAVALDAWGRSYPVFSDVVVVHRRSHRPS